MSDFAKNFDGIANLTALNLCAGFSACPSGDEMPMTAAYFNAVLQKAFRFSCCYSELGLSAGAPPADYSCDYLVDDLTDPINPTVYVWSCEGGVYAPVAPDVPVVENNPPACIVHSNQSATVGEAFSYNASSIDPESDVLTYAAVGAWPGGFVIDSATGIISAPDSFSAAVGNYTLNWTISDGENPAVPCQLTLVVMGQDEPPVPIDCSGLPSAINCADLPYTPMVPNATGYTVTFSGSDYAFTGGQIVDTTNGSGGDDTATITATDGVTSCTATIAIAACAVQSIPMSAGADCPAFPTAESGFPSVQTLGAFEAVTGGVAPITLVITGLPSGVTPDDLGNGSYRLDVASNTQPSGAVGYTVTATDANGDVFVCNGSFIEIIGF